MRTIIDGTTDMRESPDWIVLSMMANDGFCRARDDHLNFSSKLRQRLVRRVNEW
jgi:hypothetical protein